MSTTDDPHAELQRAASTPERARLALQMLAERDEALQELAKLSPRQLEAATLVAKGFSRPEIGPLMGCSRWTAQDYIRDAFQALGINRHTELTVLVTKARLS
jgi:DNA-binding NarL/FixJ family response regulator